MQQSKLDSLMEDAWDLVHEASDWYDSVEDTAQDFADFLLRRAEEYTVPCEHCNRPAYACICP